MAGRFARPGGWTAVVVAALLMLATLPGRTQGLGLITEPLLHDVGLSRIAYAQINLWATLLGAIVCIPVGSLLDRLGLRPVTVAVVLLLGLVVCTMGRLTGGAWVLFLLVLATRALGQSALSVASITAVTRSVTTTAGMAMGVYALLISVFFAAAFALMGVAIQTWGWRIAWIGLGACLLFGILPLALVYLRDAAGASPQGEPDTPEEPGLSLGDALRTPAFWVFAGSTSLFGLASSGLGLFNEAVLAERGFDRATFHRFLAATAGMALPGQLLCGWLMPRVGMPSLLGVAMLLYAAGLSAFPFLGTLTHLWALAVLSGLTAGLITVLFFAIWREAFGRTHLGWIQGAAQMLTVLASAIGPLIFALCAEWYGSYTPALRGLAAVVLVCGVAAFRLTLPAGAAGASRVMEVA